MNTKIANVPWHYMPESVGSRAAGLRPQRQTEHARAENGVIRKERWREQQLGNEQVAAWLVDRVAIVKDKGYRDRVDFHSIHSWTVFLVAVEYFQEESPCLQASMCVCWLERTVCPEKMVTVRALIVNEEPKYTTEHAFANCGKQ